MKPFRLVVAAALSTVPAFAQNNPCIVFPQDPERMAITAALDVRRPDWNLAGQGFQKVTQELIRGVGDVGGGVALAMGFYHWAGDLEGTTPETYGVILRSADASGLAPDATPAGILVSVPGLTTPVGNPGAIGWILTDVFATPAVLPTQASWFQGLEFGANPAWPNGSPPDGNSIWSADTLAASTPATVGENGRLTAPPVTITITASGGTFQTQWTYLMGTLVLNPTLHVGGIDPLSTRTGGPAGTSSYGMNGLFPDISGAPRSDGLDLRMQDNAQPNSLAIFAAATGWFAFPIPIGFTGDLYIDIGSLVVLGFAAPVNGAATLPLLMPGTISPSLMGAELMFQGLMLDPATFTGRMSNAQVTRF